MGNHCDFNCCGSKDSNENLNDNNQNLKRPHIRRTSNKQRNRSSSPIGKTQPQMPSQNQYQQIQYLQNRKIETILHGQNTGEGVKKTPAYETPLSEGKLNEWRNEFWETRTSGSEKIWNLLRNVCERDIDSENCDPTNISLIKAADLKMPQNSLTCIIDSDGAYYRIPIACINHPRSYKVDRALDALKKKEQPEEKVIKKVEIRLLPDKFVIVDISNHMTIEELNKFYIKKLYQKYQGKDVADMKSNFLRFFFAGKELQDNLYIYSYDLKNEMKIQVVKQVKAERIHRDSIIDNSASLCYNDV